MSDKTHTSFSEWTADEHYRQAMHYLTAIRLVENRMIGESGRGIQMLQEDIDRLIARAQLHATLACVDPRIRTIAESEDS